MAKRFLVPIDLAKNELRNARAHNLASAPSDPVPGQFYFDTTDSLLFWWSGTEWKAATATSSYTPSYGAVTTETTFGQASGSGVATSLSRSDHTHGTPSLGTTGSTAAAGDDARIVGAQQTDEKDQAGGYPGLDGSSKLSFSQLPTGTTADTVAVGDDTRFTDSRTPDGAAGGDLAGTYPNPELSEAIKTYLLDRGFHTGSQAASTISDLAAVVKAYRLNEFAAPTGPVALGSQRITGLADPSAAQDAATKAYVDGVATGLDTKASVRVATTANIVLSGTQTIDGIAVVAGDRVLVKNQTTVSNNGIYVVAVGAWARAADFDSSAEVTAGAFTFVEQGTSQSDTGWVLTTDGAVTVGTTSLTFSQFSGAGSYVGGAGLTLTGTVFDVGAGTGIIVGADSVGIDPAVVTRKYAETLATSATSYVVTHSLGTRDVTVSVYLTSGTYEEVEVDVERTSTTAVTVRFATAPAAGAYRVVVQG